MAAIRTTTLKAFSEKNLSSDYWPPHIAEVCSQILFRPVRWWAWGDWCGPIRLFFIGQALFFEIKSNRNSCLNWSNFQGCDQPPIARIVGYLA
jgi:hypothetical protein